MVTTNNVTIIARSGGLFLLHALFAVSGPELVGDVVHKFVRVSSGNDIIIRVWAVSVACAFLTALFMTPALRSKTALWVWVLPAVWFALGVMARSNSLSRGVFGESLFAHFSGSTCASTLDTQACRDFLVFSVTLIRTGAYSAGAFLSLFLYRKRVAETTDNPKVEGVSA